MRDKKENISVSIDIPAVIPEVKNYSSRVAWKKAVWDVIVAHFVTLRHTNKLEPLLEILLTPHERSRVIHRMAAINRILMNKEYREIEEELFLTPQTISTIKKALREEHYRSYNERGKIERKKKVYSPRKSSESSKDPFVRTRRTKYGIIKIRG
ncbi:MAG: Trp family transcriptional regulator [Patescibacteria group bacterium]